jgi:hypothetical protein
MKNLMTLFAFALFISITNAQTFYDFTSDGFPVGASFYSAPQKSIKPSANDTMLSASSAYKGITYGLNVSKTKNNAIAEKSVDGVMKRLREKANKVDAEKPVAVMNYQAKMIQYINQKGSFVTVYVFTEGRMLLQCLMISAKAYATENEATSFLNTIKIMTGKSSTASTNSTPIATNTSSSNNNTSQNTSPVTTNNSSTAATNNSWNVNDRAEIFDTKENKWFGCIILKVNSNGTYKIGYDGYADTYDEDVAANRLNKPTSNSTPAFPAYVKAIKGQTITLKGNLKNGSIMDDLEWAESSSMACWVGIRNIEFEGKHVAYWFDLPKKSIVKITVTPASTKSRINIYGYSGFDFIKTPPEVSRCTSCEAAFPEWIGQPDFTIPSKPQTIEFNATTIRNRVYFAVAGAKGVVEGDYTITIELQ